MKEVETYNNEHNNEIEVVGEINQEQFGIGDIWIIVCFLETLDICDCDKD